MGNSKTQYIAIDEAAKLLGVNRSTMYYYRHHLNVEPQRFPLDKRTYITIADFERIKEARQAAAERKH